MKKKKYGYIPDLPDKRDWKWKASEPLKDTPVVDLTGLFPSPCYDQGSLGSCSSNAITGALQFCQKKQNLKWQFMPSRLFIYYNERVMEGTVLSDSGAQIRDGVSSVNTQGVCPENGNVLWSWPYSDNAIQYRVAPLPACYTDAKKHPAITYESVSQDSETMKSVLQSGFPMVVGFGVYDSFETDQVAKTGHAPMPGSNESLLGGHAVVCCGYDDTNSWWILRNSWGSQWGMDGYFTLPYGYLEDPDLASDFWVIKVVE